MQYCRFCDTLLANDSQFCGHCGQPTNPQTEVTAITNPSGLDVLAPDTPPILSNPSQPLVVNAETGLKDVDVTIRRTWSTIEGSPSFTLPHSEEDEQQGGRNRAILYGPSLLGALEATGEMPAGQVPTVQGTPQAGGVPTVQGTPSTPGRPPASGQSFAHREATSMSAHAPASASGATTKLAFGAVSKWLIVTLTAIAVIATSGCKHYQIFKSRRAHVG